MKKNEFKFLLLFTIFFLIFVIYPIIKTIMISFFHDGTFGLENYIYTYNLSGFNVAIYNTFMYTIFVTLFEILFSLIIAYALSQKIKFKNTFQTIFFLPYVTSVVAIGTVFKIMYNSEYGIINYILGLLGIAPVEWLGSEHALLSMIILGIWKGLAFNILIIFTAFATINPNLEKAAIIDGFSNFQIFRKIKLPQIRGVMLYLLTINIIFNIKVYEEVVALFGATTPGYGGSANTLVYMISNVTTSDPSVAAVLAVTLLIIVICIRVIIYLIPKILKFVKNIKKEEVLYEINE